MTDPLFSVRVESWKGDKLLEMVGARDTVLDAALRVILDFAPAFSPGAYGLPQFRISVVKVK